MLGEGKFFSLCLLLGQILSANPKFLIGNTLQEGLTSPSQKYLFRIGKGTRQGGGKVNFFVYEWICVWKRGKVLFKGFYDKNTVKKGHVLCFFYASKVFLLGVVNFSPSLPKKRIREKGKKGREKFFLSLSLTWSNMAPIFW